MNCQLVVCLHLLKSCDSKGYTCPDTSPFAVGSGSQLGTPNGNVTAAGRLVVESLFQFGERFSEDCLTLNVWTAPQRGAENKAVLVWIYGGGFTTGSSATQLYNGQHLAHLEDVVVISIKCVTCAECAWVWLIYFVVIVSPFSVFLAIRKDR